MKKILFLLIVVMLLGCVTTKEYPRMDIPGLLDFRPYTSQNFIITTETYISNYEPVGVVSYKIIPKSFLEKPEDTGIGGKWVIEPVDSKALLDSLFIMCKKLGANGIMNFWYKYGIPSPTNLREAFTLEAGGFAIIRK